MITDQARQRERGVDAPWSRDTVLEATVSSAVESRLALALRDRRYPRMCRMLELWDGHDDEIVLDYGCGSGADITGLLLHSKVRLAIGAEAGDAALRLARERLAVHPSLGERALLWELAPGSPGLPIREGAFNFILANGALARTNDPLAVLREFRRLLAPGGRANVMVYNRESVWLHLRVAYERPLADDRPPPRCLEAAFAEDGRSHGGGDVRLWRPKDFLGLARKAGLVGEFVGGYFSRPEVACVKRSLSDAADCPVLPRESRRFLERLTLDSKGLPLHDGRYAGLGGVFRLRRS